MTVGSLFAGIGGFDLGFERAGYEIVWQVEIDEYCRRVLGRHFPRAERLGDIRECGAHNLKPVDIICGGFPCQDISVAGKRTGIDGARSGLWGEMRRIVCELQPRFVVVENVSALLYGGIERVLGELAASGYDAEWDCIPAYAVGAPHRRDRVWIVAYPASANARSGARKQQGPESTHWKPAQFLSHASDRSGETAAGNNNKTAIVAHPIIEQRNGRSYWTCGWEREPQETIRHARGRGWEEDGLPTPESLLGRVADGLPDRLDRLRGLGNAIVPQIAQWIAERIKQLGA